MRGDGFGRDEGGLGMIAMLRLLVPDDDSVDDGGDGRDEKQDLDPAIGPLALDLAAAPIHQEAVDGLFEAVGADPDREQDVLEGDVVVAGVDAVDALLVAADIAADRAVNAAVHDDLGAIEAGIEVDVIALRLEAADELFAVGRQVLEVPGLEGIGVASGEGLGGEDEDVIEAEVDGAGGVAPADFSDLTGLGLALGVGVGLGDVVGVAALAGVVADGPGVVGLEGHVAAANLAASRGLLEGVRSEPAAGEPVLEFL